MDSFPESRNWLALRFRKPQDVVAVGDLVRSLSERQLLQRRSPRERLRRGDSTSKYLAAFHLPTLMPSNHWIAEEVQRRSAPPPRSVRLTADSCIPPISRR